MNQQGSSAQHSTVLAQLDELDALLSDESKWARGSYALDSAGKKVDAQNADAKTWCILGGCRRVTGKLDTSPLADALKKTRQSYALHEFNDAPATTFADIKKLIADTRARLLKCSSSDQGAGR